MGAQGDDMSGAQAPRESLEGVGQGGMQRPTRAQQLGLIVKCPYEDEVKTVDLGDSRREIVRDSICECAGGSAIKHAPGWSAGRLAFNCDQGGNV
jgi:hypothetical protein